MTKPANSANHSTEAVWFAVPDDLSVWLNRGFAEQVFLADRPARFWLLCCCAMAFQDSAQLPVHAMSHLLPIGCRVQKNKSTSGCHDAPQA